MAEEKKTEKAKVISKPVGAVSLFVSNEVAKGAKLKDAVAKEKAMKPRPKV